MFYGRENERKKLHRMFLSDGQMISLIYGRRRIGKSELIKQALKETDIKSIYYECKQTTERNNVDSLAELIAEIFDFPKPAFENIEALLQFLFKMSEKEPMILVLDEYPYLRENAKGLDSILQSPMQRSRRGGIGLWTSFRPAAARGLPWKRCWSSMASPKPIAWRSEMATMIWRCLGLWAPVWLWAMPLRS